jgi:hypothetical protein
VAFAGGMHAVHDWPQDAGLVFDAQVLPHPWKLAEQLMPHPFPSHVASPLLGTAHAEQEEPQV